MFVGFDGGGTKCEGCVLDGQGNVLASAIGTSTNHNAVGWDSACASFTQVWRSLREKLGDNSDLSVLGACLGMSGADRDSDRSLWLDAACKVLSVAADKVVVVNDGVTALASGTGGVLNGIALISGTGTICVGLKKKKKKNPNEEKKEEEEKCGVGKLRGVEMERCQGWGPLLGDEGSGYDVGHKALQCVMRARDGSLEMQNVEPSVFHLRDMVLQHCGVSREDQLVSWAYHPTVDWSRIASLSHCVETAARLHLCPHSLHILNTAARTLAQSVKTVQKKMFFFGEEKDAEEEEEVVVVVLAGGMLRPGGMLGEMVWKQLSESESESETTKSKSKSGFGVRKLQLTHPKVSIAQAAALIALKEFKK